MSIQNQELAKLTTKNQQIRGGQSQALSKETIAEEVALLSQQSVLDAYTKMGYSAMNCRGGVVKAVSLDTRYLQAAENAFIQFDITNNDVADHQVNFGSVLGLAGSAPFFGTSASACDFPLVVDQLGAGVRAVQGFSNLCNFNNVVIDVLQLISSDTTQRAQPFAYNDIAYDDTITRVVQNTTATFTRFDNDQSVVKLQGVWMLGAQGFLSINSKTTKQMTIVFSLTGSSSVKDFRQMQGS